MKSGILFSLVIVVIIAFSSCEKCFPTCELIPAKIIRYDCDRVIFKLLTNEAIGDSNWTDAQTGMQYDNVVSYYNTCRMGDIVPNCEKRTVYVSLKKLDNNSASNCFQCQAISTDPPTKKVDFKEISLSPCELSPDK